MNARRRGLGWLSLLLACALGMLVTACGGGGSPPPPPPPPLTITTTTLPDGVAGMAYNQTLAATGGTAPLTWSVTVGTLPTGLSLAAATGVISGAPTVAGTSNFTVQVQDSASPLRTATQALTLRILASMVTITTTTLPDGVTGQPYNQTLQAGGGTPPLTWSLTAGSALPPGLSLSSGGAITGTPTTAGTFNFTVQAQDSSTPQQTATKALRIRTADRLTITTTSLPPGRTDMFYNQTLMATGGVAPLTWNLAGGALPIGMRFASGGVISGTFSSPGMVNFTVRVQDTSNPQQTATMALSITVTAGPLAIATTRLPPGTVGAFYDVFLSATGGTGPFTWSLADGTFPSGLNLNMFNGEISGTSTTTNTFNFTVRVTDSAAPPGTVTQNLSIRIAPASGPGKLGRNDTTVNATPISNGSYPATISPLVDPPDSTNANPDQDIYQLTANGGAIVAVEIFAQRFPSPSPLDSVIEIIDLLGTRLTTCRSPDGTTGLFNEPCVNDDISPTTTDSRLEFQVPAGPPQTFFVRVLDFRGDARPDLFYTITITGAN